jgi:hypothetical protein
MESDNSLKSILKKDELVFPLKNELPLSILSKLEETKESSILNGKKGL